MKSTVATAVVVAGVAAFAAAAPPCPGDELTRFFPFATHEYTKACAKETGFQLFPPTHWPTDAEYAKLCVAEGCQKLFKTVREMKPKDCDVTAFGLTANPHALVVEYIPKCAELGQPIADAVGEGNATTTNATAPAPATGASNSSSDAKTAPNVTVALPTAPTSNASAGSGSHKEESVANPGNVPTLPPMVGSGSQKEFKNQPAAANSTSSKHSAAVASVGGLQVVVATSLALATSTLLSL